MNNLPVFGLLVSCESMPILALNFVCEKYTCYNKIIYIHVINYRPTIIGLKLIRVVADLIFLATSISSLSSRIPKVICLPLVFRPAV